MLITVVPKLPARFAPPDVVSHFHNLEATVRKNGEKRAVSVSGNGTAVVLNVNVGAFKNFETAEARRIAGAATIKHVKKSGGKRLLWSLESTLSDAFFRQLVTGALLASYRFEAYKGKAKKRTVPGTLTIVAGKRTAAFKKILRHQELVVAGVATARDLANTPGNDLVPADLVSFARKVARTNGLTCKALTATQLKRERYAGITAVGGASAHPPALFVLSYKPRRIKRGAKPLCLVGKGITFDSGGISLKPWSGMWDMKGDMSGAAAVIGAMEAIAKLKPPVPVTGVVAAAENLPGAAAYRPGDILRYRNGRTVEIRSTDAEGRLILADALLYAQEVLKQKRIVEFSTLTGACMRALGRQYMGLMSRTPTLVREVKGAAERAGEGVWSFPLHPEYRAMIDSPIADIRNTGGPFAGAQTAGWFLHEFIRKDVEYVHLDIAGAFLTDKEDKYWSQVGATGVGVRLAVALAEDSAGT